MMKEIILVLGCLLVMAQAARMNPGIDDRQGRQYVVVAPPQARLNYGNNLFATRPSTPTFNRYGQNAFSNTKCEIRYETKCQEVCTQEPVENCQSFEYYPDK